MSSIQEELQEIVAQERALADRKKALREKAIGDVVAQLEALGITKSELLTHLGISFDPETLGDGKIAACDEKAKVSRRKAEPKYVTPDGLTLWSGRGRAPKAFQVLLDAGAHKEDFLINK